MIHDIRWTIEKIAARLALIAPLVYRRRAALTPWAFTALPGPLSPPPVDPALDDSAWPRIAAQAPWGRDVDDFVLRNRFRIPDDWPPDPPVALYLPLGDAESFSHPEALVYINGQPFAGCDRHHRELLLRDDWRDGQPHALALHGWTGYITWRDAGQRGGLLMGDCALVQIDPPTRAFLVRARVALGTVRSLPPEDPARGPLLNALDAAFNQLDIREPFDDHFYASIEGAHATLNEGIAVAGPAHAPHITATGHAHIDVAWLWPLGQTRRKAGRTFHNVLRLMEQFPDFHFTQSQPQLYYDLQHDYPALLPQIKQRVAEGRWEPIGGMWVEADCNLSGAESLARQFLLGRTFFRELFGADAESPVLWLPDVFGYAWALPQLIKQAGLDYFFTIKIGWNQYNRLPYDSFWWQGIDGTRVLTHFSTTTANDEQRAATYNALATPEEAQRTWRNFQQKASQRRLLMAFGYGDGGGGPTREMLENLHEMRDFPALPRVEQRAVKAFFDDMARESGDRLPTWNGELYLEYHRGTYTTQARNKRANRQAEFLLHDAEFLAAWASQQGGYDYPHEALTRAWRLLCLNQFHDIIPGSSIHDVYVESLAQYDEIREIGDAVRRDALAALAPTVGGDWLVVNATSFERRDLALLPTTLGAGQTVADGNGNALPHQCTAQGLLVDVGALPPYSVSALSIVDGTAPDVVDAVQVDERTLENAGLHVELNDDGDIVRLYDKQTHRELLPKGAVANQWQAFEDRPLKWDAWDIDIFYDDRHWLANPATSIRVVEQGPLRATLEIKRQILNSRYVQRLSLLHNSSQLTIETEIDWRERHILLKAAFPLNLLSPYATYEIQWGKVERPTHRNTSWDWARFESCAQKWVDLSEGDYGVSLLNDGKYGHDARDNVIRLSLLRSPTWPDPEADQGPHRFVYALYPHRGAVGVATLGAAYALNDPLIVQRGSGGAASAPQSLLWCDAPNVVIETVKQAEDGRGLVVRLFESQRQRGTVTLHSAFPLAAVARTNLLEDAGEALALADQTCVTLPLRPFEIVTLRLVGR
ncbi:MAG: alpha-mannosidase [Anaerolineales bacterium]|nr:alpha-mannosidase [Anaerolineales bacterium]